ncbi:MAG TPA: hypothetical protein VK906_11075 [Egicoccus sp.]|nr:hypothetical protein [Egicoccus sp.]HSK23712.1 hypothetical protein [Egicoccus sp.]
MSAAEPPQVHLGVVAAPAVGRDVAAEVVAALPGLLERRYAGTAWQVTLLVDALVAPPADDDDLVEAAHDRLLAEDFDLLLVLTDLPVDVDGRAVVGHASPLHGVGVLCVPALGPLNRRRRALDASVRLLDVLLDVPAGADDATATAEAGERLRDLATDFARGDDRGLVLAARVLTGKWGLLFGMVRANHPWRLALRLSRALAAAGAVGILAMVTPDVWLLADDYSLLRHSLLALAVIAIVCATLIVGARLWDRPPTPRAREQVTLFNLATLVTVAIGVTTLYGVLFLLAQIGAFALLTPGVLTETLGHPIRPADVIGVAWLTTTLSMLGGALGAGIESDDAVREAAYSHRTGGDTVLEATPAG